MDAWILLRNVEANGERNRIVYVLKSRGMAHSNQIREFFLTDRGIRLREVYIGPGGVLTGSARVAQEAEERRQESLNQRASKDRQLAAKVAVRTLEAKIAELQAEKQARQNELATSLVETQEIQTASRAERDALRRSRGITESSGTNQRPNGRAGKS